MNDEERIRYSRQLMMPEVGPLGQERIKAARVLCIGAGGLGSPASLYLAAAGVGTLGLIDFDDVDLSNLQRQILHGTKDVGRKKVESAAERLRDINPKIDIETQDARFTSGNARALVARFDIVVDGSDNFPTRYLSNDVCVWEKKPNIYGSVFRFEGQSTVFAPHLAGPCYRCLFPEPPPPGTVPNCAEAGVLGIVPGLIGLIQATETLKLILASGECLTGRLLHFDALKMKFREFNVRRDPRCPVCGDAPSIIEPIDYEQFCNAGPAAAPSVRALSVQELKSKLAKNEPVVIVDVREPFECEIAKIDNAKLIPLGELPERLEELDRTQEIVAMCHSGMRSALAVDLLQEAGFKKVFNLAGGIDAWAVEIDPTMARY